MDRFEQTRAAIVDRLRELKAEPAKSINLFDLGTALIPAGYDEQELGNALFSLERDKVIELIEGNRLRIVRPLK